ncbi:hypothetical protein TREMEDRAFT_69594 [Tremella mesenterica DSM 1558]|uniref:uncharacterized protein n=1 Tax=Tremella mesenterica (strain ATCC 24925 / CBS 8224 / DSM 1558 / NBRC 9311 / NRRL Y-6157 / RJB 2259-6 / UBC 559-6) TaxID=578456 RepID=UPI0003F49B4F|nr:uncharacterized protein TREMEDRAFT_69594 [Tremella mesenterica DSM 1558]EIW68145.1 hypothetical protein TREMEDRAFT_69594 [Tremella mesenterica DSM 1558]
MGSDQPKGGHDPTPLPPSTGPSYNLRITFHRASNLPIADFASRSCDPYILAQINTSLPTRHPRDPKLRFRSPTIHRNVNPTFDAQWLISGVPSSGMTLKVRLYDEDANDYDDRLGKLEIETGEIDEDWKGIKEKEYKVHKTGADVRAYTLRSCARLLDRTKELHARLVLSVEVLGKTKEDGNVGKVYTVGCFWRTHYSPIIGRLTGTKGKDEHGVERFDFQANEIQLRGPVPNELYHRYVEFKSFVMGMFESTGVRGKVLNRALHHQHAKIYNYNSRTRTGVFEDDQGPGREMTLKFLDMAHYDQGGRIFTYVVTLDGMFRFTETGKEFGIDLLSKHTMHSDVDIYIAWSGEFLIRRLSNPHSSSTAPDQHTHPAEPLPNGPPSAPPPQDPESYELIIDNDSGTYRPLASLIPIFQKFLQSNFPGLHIHVMSCTDEKLTKIKDAQRATKGKEGDRMVYGQGSVSGSSLSVDSSDEEELERRARNEKVGGGYGEGERVWKEPERGG